MGAALACLGAGSAAGAFDDPLVPTFDGPYTFAAPGEPRALAVTPPGFDLVGTGLSMIPDGFAEVAVAAELEGRVVIYRNQNLWDSSPSSSLSVVFDINVFADLNISTTLDGTDRITQIELVDMTGDLIPDLVVSAISGQIVGGEATQVGHIAVFEAQYNQVTNVVSGFDFRSSQMLDLPATGFTIGGFNNDGLPDVLVACVDTLDPASIDSSRVFVIKNTNDGNGAGVLVQQPDEDFPAMFNTSSNIVSGEFRLLTSGGMGGGLGGGSTLDFVSFGGANPSGVLGSVVLGSGAGDVNFGFTLYSKYGSNCGSGALDAGLSGGTDDVFDGNEIVQPKPLVKFDPFATTDQSLATTISISSVRLIHNKPRFGVFYHLCGPSTTADVYLLDNCSTGGVPPIPPLNAAAAYLTSGNLNGDAYDDLVHIDPTVRRATMLLGRGTPDADNKILYSPCGNTLFQKNNYAPITSSDNLLDQAVCADLDNDGYDEIIISRYARLTTNPNAWGIVVYHNTTGN